MSIADSAWVAGDILLIASFFAPRHLDPPLTAVAGVLWIAAGIAMRNWVVLACGIVLIADTARRWRRRRKRAPKSAGYKARALIAAIVRRAREAAHPRPVLIPVPGGVRA